jgi:plastocyanin
MFPKSSVCLAMAIAAGLAPGPAWADTITVTIDNLVFSPAEINAEVGDTIMWINKDAMVHTATVKDGWEVKIPPNKTVMQVLQTVETVDYYCRFHPNMKGRLTVSP